MTPQRLDLRWGGAAVEQPAGVARYATGGAQTDGAAPTQQTGAQAWRSFN